MDKKDLKLDNHPLDNMNWAKEDYFSKDIYECVQDLIEYQLWDDWGFVFRYNGLYYMVDIAKFKTKNNPEIYYLARYDKDRKLIDCVGLYTEEEIRTLPIYEGKTLEEMLKLAEFWG